MQPITGIPCHLKPRERLLREGSSSVSLVELLAVILGTGSSKFGVLEVAEMVRAQLVNGVTCATELGMVEGVGISKALRIVAALALREAIEQQTSVTSLSSPGAIFERMEDLLEKPQEHLVCFYLTVRKTHLKREIVSVGTVSASLLHPREVFRPAILSNAVHIVLAHNHPSGIAEPSQADFQATRMIADAGRLLGIELLDHVICSKDGFVSLKVRYPELFVGNQTPFC